MNTYTITIWIIFFIINALIIHSDILHRKIKNNSLLLLILLLPFWYGIFGYGSMENILAQTILSITLLWYGIFFYKENGFIWSGDIKYMAILLLFLGQLSIPIFIGNIGVLTIITLILWWCVVLGEIFGIRMRLWSTGNAILIPKFTQKKIIIWLGFFILDWLIIGFFLSLFIIQASLKIFTIIPSWGDLYFLISISVFLFRPALRYIITRWQYRIFPIVGLILFFGTNIQKIGIEAFEWEILFYISNIWQYAVIFILIKSITEKTFDIHKKLLEKLEYTDVLRTIPYSIIIFVGFFLLFFYDIHLMNVVRNF